MSDRRNNQRGFALAPVLYLLGLIGVTASVLFTGYSQVVRSNIAISDSIAVRNDLNAATQILAASSKLGSDGTTLCLPPGSSPGATCATVVVKMANLSGIASSDAHLPTIYSGGNPATITQSATIGTTTPAKEVGIFPVGAGIKQLDPWGHYYIYCRWENLTTIGATSPAMIVITAGADGELETNCDAAAAATPVACNLKAGCDDTIYFMNVGTTVNHSTLWQAGTTTVGSSTVADVTYGVSPLTVDANGNLTVPGTSLLEQTVNTSANVNVGGNLTGASGGTLAIGSSTTMAGQLTTTGSVGVGTASPAYPLQVIGNMDASGTVLSGSGSAALPAFAMAAQPNQGMYFANSSEVDFAVSGIHSFLIDSARNFDAASSTGGSILVASASATAPTYAPNRSDSKAGIGANAAGNVSVIADNAGTATEMLRVSGTQSVFPAGLVGIGTTTPKSELDVYGGVAIGTSYAGVTAAPANGAIVQGSVGIGTASPAAPLQVVGNTMVSGRLDIDPTMATTTFTSNGVTVPYYGLVSGEGTDDGGYYSVFFSAYKTIRMFTMGAEALRITSNGSVGIGTTAPSTALQVVGTATATTFAGTVPVTDLNSGTGASSSTYWRGDGTWAVPTIALGTSTTGTLPVGDLSGTPTGGSGPYNQVYVNSQGLVTAESYTAFNSSQWITTGTSIYYNVGNVGIGTSTPNANAALDLSANTNGMLLPVGTTAQEPTCSSTTQGETRYNSTTGTPEFCNGLAWTPFKATGAPSGSGYFVLSYESPNGCMNAPITSITHSGTTATLTTSYPHGLTSGASVTVSGSGTQSAYYGTFTITVTSSTTFTYTMGSTPTATANGGNAYCSGSGGLAAANALCLYDLTTYTSWFGYKQANAAGLLTSGHVTAFLCDGTTCNEPDANTTYYFANNNDGTSGGSSFTTNSSGLGPNNSVYWALGATFGGYMTFGEVNGGISNYWTGRAQGASSTQWPNTSSANSSPFYGTCNGWTSADYTGTYFGTQGGTGNANYQRWYGGNGNGQQGECISHATIICMVNP